MALFSASQACNTWEMRNTGSVSPLVWRKRGRRAATDALVRVVALVVVCTRDGERIEDLHDAFATLLRCLARGERPRVLRALALAPRLAERLAPGAPRSAFPTPRDANEWERLGMDARTVGLQLALLIHALWQGADLRAVSFPTPDSMCPLPLDAVRWGFEDGAHETALGQWIRQRVLTLLDGLPSTARGRVT